MTHYSFRDLPIHPANKGRILSAKVYPGERVTTCPCGGKFTAHKHDRGLSYPVCSSCERMPATFRIRAKIETEDGGSRYYDIRTTQDGKKFEDHIDLLFTLKQIRREISEGEFDAQKYANASVRKGLFFERFTEEYLAFNMNRLKRGDITPYGFAGKKKYVKVLVGHFGKLRLSQITTPRILEFKNSFTDKITTRNLALTELKTILKHAALMQKIKYVPEFGRVDGTGLREVSHTIDEIRKIIPHIENETYRMMAVLMAECALRPSEVRAIQWRDISIQKGKITICRHFSINKLIEGRKSNLRGKNSTIEHGIPLEFEHWLRSQPTPMDPSRFVFSNRAGAPIQDVTLNQAWTRTLQKLGIPHFQMYDMRHARGSEVVEKTGNMIEARNFLGHSSVTVTERRYERTSADNHKHQVR